MDLSICIFLHLFCFFDLLFLCFYFAFLLLLFCFFFAFFQAKSKQKAKKKANRKSKINAKKCKWTSPFFSFFFPFCLSIFFPFILLPVFFGFEVLLFDFPCVFLFFAFFSSLKNIRISYRGGHNDSTVFDFGGPPARL